MKSMSQLRCILVCQFTISFLASKLYYKCFSYNDIFLVTLGLGSFMVCCITYGNNVWNYVSSQLRYSFVWWSYFGTFKLHTKMTWNYVSFLFVVMTYFLVCYNYVIYLLNVVTFFDDVRNRFYFGTFELLTEITLQLRFNFVRHCNVFFITSKLSYLFVPCSYVFWWR